MSEGPLDFAEGAIIPSFPAGVFGLESLRLPVLHNDEKIFIVSKPSGISVRQNPWELGANLDRVLNEALMQKRHWAMRLNCQIMGSVFPLEQAISGPVLYVKNASALAEARNAFGSYAFEFCYLLIVQESEKMADKSEVACKVPLYADAEQKKMHPSWRKGKRCESLFRRLKASGNGWSLWQAQTSYPRMHQIRAHAQAIGLSIAGDCLYGTSRVPVARELIGKGSGPGLEKPLLKGIGVHLQSLILPKLFTDGSALAIDCPPPDDFTNCLRKLVDRS
jgi:23S rRNA-/tRNA-specific pseudouridylate synthase